MAAEIELADAERRAIVSWRVEGGHLLLAFSGASEDRTLRCICRRSHWIVETRGRGGRAFLAVRCHACGTHRELPLAPPPVPPDQRIA